MSEVSDHTSDRASDLGRPSTLTLALSSVLRAAVDGGSRTGLLAVVRPDAGQPRDRDGDARVVVPFPAPRRPLDDDPTAA